MLNFKWNNNDCNMGTRKNQFAPKRVENILSQKGADFRQSSVRAGQRFARRLKRIRSEAAGGSTAAKSQTTTTGWASPDLSTHLCVIAYYDEWQLQHVEVISLGLSCTLAPRLTASPLHRLSPFSLWIVQIDPERQCCALCICVYASHDVLVFRS